MLAAFLKLFETSFGTKEMSFVFRYVTPIMLVFILQGQDTTQKNIIEAKKDLSDKIAVIETKIDQQVDNQRMITAQYNDWRRETEGRLSYLEASTGIRRRRTN